MKRGRRRSDGESDEEEDDGNDFIVRPESNHSMIKQREFGFGGRLSGGSDED